MATKATFVKEGKTVDIHADAAINCGDIKVVAGSACIALWDIPAGADGSLHVLQRGEVVKLATAAAIGETAAGVGIYLDSDGNATKTAESNTLLGYTEKAVVAGALEFNIVCV